MRCAAIAACLALTTASAAFADQASAFFDDSAVREIRLYFDDANWYNTLFQSHQRSVDDPYFPCRFRSGDITIDKIGCRFKGNSSFQRNGIKKPFKLDFNEYDDDASFFGLKKLNLNNFDIAPDFMREKLLHDFAGKYVAALRSVYVRLYINDAFYGLYLAVEQPDKTMMQSRYGIDEDGNLYEAEEGFSNRRPDLTYLGSDQSLYQNVYLLKTNEDENDFSGLIHFLDVLNNTPTAELASKLETVADVENWLTGMAINNLFVNLDSYLGVGAEYYLYHRSSDSRFVHIQWDHNESFGTTGDGTPRIANPFTLDPFYLPSGGTGPGGGGGTPARPLLQKLWSVNEYRRLYLRMLARMLREGFDTATVSARVQQLANLIRADVNADPNKAYTAAQFETALNSQMSSGQLTIYGVNQFVRERYNYLRPALNALALPADIRLNEVVTVNAGGTRDSAGDADPWVELYNPGPGPVTLTGFYLSDDPSTPTKWSIPNRTLADGEFLVIWLDGETTEGDTHANFRVQATGGSLYLYAGAVSSQDPIDKVTYPAIATGQSYIRLGWHGSTWTTTSNPTAGAANPSVAVPSTPNNPSNPSSPTTGTGQLLINEVMADNDGSYPDPDEAGAFEDWFEVYNPGSTAVDMSGMYLTDNLNNPTKFKVPNGVTVPARGYAVFIADSEAGQGNRHTSFSLSADGEALAIYQADGTTLIDSITFGVQQTEVSWGRTTDGAGDWSIFSPATPGTSNAQPYANWMVNAASFAVAPAAPGAIASAFNQNFASTTLVTQSTTLPATLGGVSVSITDSANASRPAGLFFVSPGQVNFQIPAGTAPGRAKVTITRQNGTTVTGDLLVDSMAPGLFSANASGKGVGLIGAVRADGAGRQTTPPVFTYDAAAQSFVAVPIDLGAATDQTFLLLYGTGIRGVSKVSDVSVEIGGSEVPVTYAGAQSEFPGLDQVNVGPLPKALAGKGVVEVVITVDGRRTNRVTVQIQ